jgi:hypothetical protein
LTFCNTLLKDTFSEYQKQVPKFTPVNLKFFMHIFYISAFSYVDDVNILGGSIHSTRKNTEAVVGASQEMGLK